MVQFNASSVPVLQISLSSDTLSEQQLYDYGIYRIRQQLAPIPGITLPTPAGGKYRQIMVDLDPSKLLAKGLTPLDVVNAVNAQNLTLPAGTAKFGHTQYAVRTNATPASIDDLNNIPVKVVNGATIFVKDVGQVHDGWLVQQNVVRQNGRRSVLLSIIKNGNASTLSVVNAVHEALKTARAAAPPGMQIKELFDQSVFVKQSVAGVLREGAIAAGSHGADDLAVPGIVAFDPGGHDLDPAVDPHLAGRAVFSRRDLEYDDARRAWRWRSAFWWTIPPSRSKTPIACSPRKGCRCRRRRCTAPPASRSRHWYRRSPSVASSPRWCSSTGRRNILFTPLGLAVVFAMLASYGLSRTLTPIVIGLLLKGENHGPAAGAASGLFARFHAAFRASLRGDAARLFALARRTDQASLRHSDRSCCCCWRSVS